MFNTKFLKQFKSKSLKSEGDGTGSSPMGFTLIELLLVVGLIGVLAGVMTSVINITQTKDRARDGVRMADLEKLIQGIEAFYTVESKYPAQGNYNNPLGTGAADATALGTYLKNWPGYIQTGGPIPAGSEIYYYYFIDTDNFALGIKKSGTSQFYKYHSTWTSIRTCAALAGNALCP